MPNVKSDKHFPRKVLDEFPLKIGDVAAILGCHHNTVRRMIKKGHIQQQWCCGRVRFKRKWVDDYLNRNRWDPKRDGGAQK